VSSILSFSDWRMKALLDVFHVFDGLNLIWLTVFLQLRACLLELLSVVGVVVCRFFKTIKPGLVVLMN